MCMIRSTIHAQDVTSLHIISSAANCLSYSTIYLPNNGNVTIHAHTAVSAFASNTLYSGSSTKSIQIHCNNHNRTARAYTDNICNDLWLNASMAHYLYIAITHTSIHRAHITCPSNTNTTCIINATQAISLQNTTITAARTMTIYIGIDTDISGTEVQCADVITRDYDDAIQCSEKDIYEHTLLPITTTFSNTEGDPQNLLNQFLSLPLRIYVMIIASALIICICCTVLCMKCTYKWIEKTQPEMVRSRTATSIRRALSDASVMQDVKRMLELASSTPQTMATDTISKHDMTPHQLHSSSDIPIDTLDIGGKRSHVTTMTDLEDEPHMMSSMMPFSPPGQHTGTIVEDGKNIDMDEYEFRNFTDHRSSSVAVSNKPKKKKTSIKISGYLKFRKTAAKNLSKIGKSLSERGFTVNQLYGLKSADSMNEEDEHKQATLQLEDKDEEDTVSEASTFTLMAEDSEEKSSSDGHRMEIEDSTFTVRDNAITLTVDGGADFANINTLHEAECEPDDHEFDEEGEEENTPPLFLTEGTYNDSDHHFRSQTEGTETNPLSLRLPPKVTP
eukprot:196238_1